MMGPGGPYHTPGDMTGPVGALSHTGWPYHPPGGPIIPPEDPIILQGSMIEPRPGYDHTGSALRENAENSI